MSQVAAILLAAGESRRWGAGNKLLAPIGGTPMIRRAAQSVLASRVRPVIVVTGHQAEAIEAVLADLAVTFRHAPDFATGLSASLKAGLAALPEHCEAALVCLGDMPFIQPETFDLLADAFDPGLGWTALIPTFEGRRGNPVLIDRRLFPEISRLSGDQGARGILASIPERVREVAVEDSGILRDLDTPETPRT